MFKTKRILACIIVIALAIALAAACDNGSSRATPFTPPNDGLDNNTRGMAKYEEPITVTFARNVDPNATFAPGQSYQNNIWITEYRDVLGINLETVWEAEGLIAYDERMNLMIAANDLPDVFAVNGAQLVSLVQADRVVDLAPYVEYWATDFYRDNLYADGGLSMDQSTIDGKLVALPRTGVGIGFHNFLFVRDDWRKELGLPEPTTFDDLVNMARAFVEADLDGQNAYGFGIGNDAWENWFTMRGLFNSFGGFSRIWIEKDGKLEYGNVQPEIKTALGVFHEWFAEGLMDREFTAKNSWDVSLEALAGRVGIASAEGWLLGWPLPDGISNGQEWKPYLIPFHESATQHKYVARASSDGGYVARKGFDNPEALIKMCNLWQDRIMSGNHDLSIYKGDDEFVYEFLAAFTPTNGPDRNFIANGLINDAITSGNPSAELTGNQEYMRWFESVRDFHEGFVRIDFVANEGDDPVRIEMRRDDVWAHLRGERELQISDTANRDEIINQLRGRFVGNYIDYNGRFGPKSTHGLTLHMMNNDMFMLDKFFGPPGEQMSLFYAGLQSDFDVIAINIIAGVQPLSDFDQFVTDWYANGGQEITDEVNEWYKTMTGG